MYLYVLFVAKKPTTVPRGGATSKAREVARLVDSYLAQYICTSIFLSEYAHPINKVISLSSSIQLHFLI